jgi:hypothetical protein
MLTNNPENVVVIHYSCQSFYDRPDGASPRITSIAVRNLGTGQTTSFSIHQMAERDKKLKLDQINAYYDELEKKMLKEFYEYAEQHQSHIWLHWNMRDINYGFPALEHRFKVLGGKPFEIHESRRCDLARVLVGLYGVGYIGHPRLARLVEKNKISDRDFLTGEDEAQAFEKGEYVKLHQSTLRKVDILANICSRTADGTLKTNARFHEIYGGYFAYAKERLAAHWIVALLGIAGAIASIVALILYFVSKS